MKSLADELRRPSPFDVSWFFPIATRLLTQTQLIAGDCSHRLIEIEFYYFGPEHEDPFAHRDPLQRELGRWYFHKTGGTYRSGSFKGLDLTFGDGTAYGGILFRGLETHNGAIIDGPSLLVDHLLKVTHQRTVRELDALIAERTAWETTSPIRLEPSSPQDRFIVPSARVGLTLKKAVPGSLEPQFIGRAYRFLTEPRRTKKGKDHIVRGLAAMGRTAEEIRELTGSPLAGIQRYLANESTARG
jgi:hypothetical protein